MVHMGMNHKAKLWKNLKEEDKEAFKALMKEYHAERKAVMEKNRGKKLEKGQKPTEEQMDAFMKQGYAVRKALLDLEEKYYGKFRKFLAPWQAAQTEEILGENFCVAMLPTATIGGVSLILYGMISAIGVSYLLQNLATYLFSALPKGYPSIGFLTKSITVGGISTSVVTFITPILTLAFVFLLMQLINHTKIGMAMRAVSKDFETSQLMGIKINRVISFTFIIGCFLAATGSILYFTPRPSVYPLVGSLPGTKCFIAAVFGGIGSIPGAMLGGFVIGLSETFIKAAGYSEFSDVFTFILLIVVLLFKPTGLFGEKITEKV